MSLATITTFPVDFEVCSAILSSAFSLLQENSFNGETPSSILHVCSSSLIIIETFFHIFEKIYKQADKICLVFTIT